MKVPNDDMHLPKGCKIIIDIKDEMRLGAAKLLVKQLRSQIRATTISHIHFSIETESPEYNGPEKIWES